MAKRNLTKTVVDRLRPESSEYVLWDAALPGFGVRVKPRGVKSFVLQYRNRQTGISRRKTLGQCGPLLTLHRAKEQARVILAEALSGGDPVEAAKARRAAPTMADLAADYLNTHAVPKKRPRSVVHDRSLLDRAILPRLKSKKVADITVRDIQSLHVAMQGTPYPANRLLALFSKMFALAVQWGWRADNPVKGIERYAENRRERWLSQPELTRLMDVLVAHPNQRAANAVRLQILTGARIGEVLGARWHDIDLDRGLWTKPSHQTKQKRTEHLPLSDVASALLREMREPADGHSPFVFPGDAPEKPLQDIKKFWR